MFEHKAKTLSGEWVYGSYIKRYKNMKSIAQDIATHWILPFDKNKKVQIDPVTLSLYSGRKDVNEQKIYSGDIIKLGSSNGLAVVEFLATTGFFLRLRKHGRRATFAYVGKANKVMGNIMDNPELMSKLAYGDN